MLKPQQTHTHTSKETMNTTAAKPQIRLTVLRLEKGHFDFFVSAKTHKRVTITKGNECETKQSAGKL